MVPVQQLLYENQKPVEWQAYMFTCCVMFLSFGLHQDRSCSLVRAEVATKKDIKAKFNVTLHEASRISPSHHVSREETSKNLCKRTS